MEAVDWRRGGEGPGEVWIPWLVRSRLKAPVTFLGVDEGYLAVRTKRGQQVRRPVAELPWVGLVERDGVLLLEAGEEEQPRAASWFAATLLGLEERTVLSHDAELAGIIAGALEDHVRPEQLGSTPDTVRAVRAHAEHLASGGPVEHSPLRERLPEKEPSPGFFRRLFNDAGTF